MRSFLFDKNTVFSQISKEKNNQIMSDDFDLSEDSSAVFENGKRC